MVLLLVLFLPKTKSNSSGLDCDYDGLGDCSCGCSICIWEAQSSSFNPAVTIGVALKGGLPWASVFPYILAQFAGAMLGQIFGLVAIQTSLRSRRKCRQYSGNLQYWASH